MASERGRGGGTGYGLSKVYLRGGVGVDELARRHTQVYIHTHALQTRTHILSSDSHSTRDITRNIASTNEVWRLSCLAQSFSVPKGKVSEVIRKV